VTFPGIAKPRPALRLAVLVVATVAALAGCVGRAGGSFDPAGPCAEDGQRPGAYPELEALIPTTFDGVPPDRLDSGRNCSATNLGSLNAHGIDELRFAGGLWETGARSGVTIAAFQAPGLTMERLAEFYETGARGARKTENISVGDYAVGSVEGRRLDTLNDESFQTILVLAAESSGLVPAVLVASDIREIGTREAHDAVVERAAAAAADG
jgi:hypothetical protein